MLSYDSCPEKLHSLPDYPTLDGVKFEVTKIYPHNQFGSKVTIGEVCPTLNAIGLGAALLEVEQVLAWNQTEKHPGAKWKSKSIDWHDSKAVSHLSKAQNESLKDDETGCSHRAHACCRLLMSLAHELTTAQHHTAKQLLE